MDRIELDLTDEAMTDLRALPDKNLRNPTLGGLYFDEGDTPLELSFVPRRRSEEGAGYRIVYRLLTTEVDVKIVQPFAVGLKYGPEGGVYARAAERYQLLLEQEEGG